MSDPSIRCFAAVEVAAPGVRRALELFQFNLKRAFGPRDPVRWVPAHQFHFTLKFFGEIEPDAARRAADGLARVAAQTPPFTLEVAGLGTFPGAGVHHRSSGPASGRARPNWSPWQAGSRRRWP